MKAPRSSTSNSRNPGRTAFGAIGWAIALVIAVDLLCRAALPRGWLLEYEDFVRQRVESEPAPEVQVVGDSVARSGVLVSALTGGFATGRNDAIPAGGTPKTYLLLAKQFEAGHIPKALVIAHSPHTLGQIRYEVLIGSFAHLDEVPELFVQSEPWTDALYGVLTRFSYLLMHRDSFRDLIRRGDASFFREKITEMALPPDPERLERFRRELADGKFATSQLRPVKAGAHDKPFEVKPMNDYYLRRILELAKVHGVKVFWLTPPFPKRVIDGRAPSNYEAQLVEYLSEFESRGELTVLRAGFIEYPDEMFRDDLHLNAAGVVRLACELSALRGPVVDAVVARPNVTRISAGSESNSGEVSATLEPYCRAMLCPSAQVRSLQIYSTSNDADQTPNLATCRNGFPDALSLHAVSVATRTDR